MKLAPFALSCALHLAVATSAVLLSRGSKEITSTKPAEPISSYSVNIIKLDFAEEREDLSQSQDLDSNKEAELDVAPQDIAPKDEPDTLVKTKINEQPKPLAPKAAAAKTLTLVSKSPAKLKKHIQEYLSSPIQSRHQEEHSDEHNDEQDDEHSGEHSEDKHESHQEAGSLRNNQNNPTNNDATNRVTNGSKLNSKAANVSPENSFIKAAPDYAYNPPPSYPESARRLKQQGTVVLKAKISQSGEVAELAILDSSSCEILDKAALNAVKTWRFKPALLAGNPIESEVEVPVKFELQ